MGNRLSKLVGRAFGGKVHIRAETLKKWNLAVAALLVVQGLAIAFFSGTYAVPLYVVHMTGDALQSKLQGITVVAPAIHELWSVNISYLVAAMLILTGVGYAMAATVWRVRYEAWLKRGVQPLRWMILAVAGSILLMTLGLLTGVNNLIDLKLLIVLNIIAVIMAAVLEGRSVRELHADASVRLMLVVAIVAAVVPPLAVFFVMLSSVIFGNVVIPGYLWWLYGTVVVGWLAMAANAHCLKWKAGKWSNYLYGEVWYIGLVFLIETLVAWELFAAVLHP